VRRGLSYTILVSAAALLPLLSPVAAFGQPRLGGPLIDGSVTRARGCGNYFFIVYGNQFALAEWLGGDPVRDNEVLQTLDDQGSFEREGRETVLDLASGRTVDIMIDQALMNQTDYQRTVKKICH
jgi:hypothetical protein